ncbi:MAG TPA: twin-arginine translocase TatA/TatE family subunit [Longimicrobiales bacterium]|nr:twin-arginine translocase TatA/TatE family subunit [Longimicrobiales bacterium]
MPFGLGFGELLIIFAVLLLVFGAKRLPELGGALGKGIREFKTSVRDIEGEIKRPPETPPRELHRPAAPPPQDVPSAPTGETRSEPPGSA